MIEAKGFDQKRSCSSGPACEPERNEANRPPGVKARRHAPCRILHDANRCHDRDDPYPDARRTGKVCHLQTHAAQQVVHEIDALSLSGGSGEKEAQQSHGERADGNSEK